MSLVIGVSGKINSGKTTLVDFIATKFKFSKISFGNYIRTEAEIRGINETRESLQALGQYLMDKDVHKFCENVLYSTGWNGKSNLVIDGLRHVEVYNTLKELVKPNRFYLLYIYVNDEIRNNRFKRDGLSIVDNHPTENDVKRALPSLADYVVNGDNPITTLKEETAIWINDLMIGC